MGDDRGGVDHASYGSGIRNAEHRVGSGKAKVTRPGKQPDSPTEDQRPPSGRTARRNRRTDASGQE
jgi:hypothetical protein